MKNIGIALVVIVLILVGCDEVVKNGDITGQGFLKTKGGSVRTCAGNSVYMEKSNPNGFLVLNESLENKKESIKSTQLSLDFYERNLAKQIDELKRYSSPAYFNTYISNTEEGILAYKKSIIRSKEINSKDKVIINKHKEHILLQNIELTELEEKIKNSIQDNILETMCDAQGNYTFSKVALGKYYIRTVVQWYVGDERQGGIISKTINVKEGKNRIMLTE